MSNSIEINLQQWERLMEVFWAQANELAAIRNLIEDGCKLSTTPPPLNQAERDVINGKDK